MVEMGVLNKIMFYFHPWTLTVGCGASERVLVCEVMAGLLMHEGKVFYNYLY